MFSPDIFGWVAGWVFYHSSYSCQVMFTLHGEQAVAVWIDTTTFYVMLFTLLFATWWCFCVMTY
jgi:hypothetical protein